MASFERVGLAARGVAAASALSIVFLCMPSTAGASFTSLKPVTATYSTLTVLPPTGVTASVSCLFQGTVTASWTAPVGFTPTGYQIYEEKTTGTPTKVKTVSGTTTSTTFTIPILTTYRVIIKTTVGTWTSVLSTPSAKLYCLF